MQAKDIPNLLTMSRLAMIPPIIYLIATHAYQHALLLFFIAGFTDALDGFLAKKFKWQSSLGSILDPVADKLLIISSYLVLSYVGHIPWWLTFAIISRDAIIFIGALFYSYNIDELEYMQPSVVSKINTFSQIFLVLLVLFSLAFNIVEQTWIDSVVYMVLTTTFLSGADYVWTWGLKAWRFDHD